VIVGAGQAGLGVSYYLQREHRRHVVLERGRVGESWLSQRWDSFKLNTLNVMNALPGLPNNAEPDGFCRAGEQAAYYQRYVEQFHLPVRTGVTVASIGCGDGDERFCIRTNGAGSTDDPLWSRSVVIASGSQHAPKIPAVSTRLPADITRLHTSSYRNPAALPLGAVVIVGSGQSGCQIAEDLLSAGRTVYLCTSRVGRVPRRYRGRDLLEWWIDMQMLDTTYASLQDKSVSRMPQPQVSGLGRYGHTLSLQQLSRQGAVILGHLLDVEPGILLLGDDAADNVHFADAFSKQQKDGIDAYLQNSGITPPPLEDDPADVPDPLAECVSPLRRLDLSQAQVSTVIWATGFTADFHWINLPAFDAEGKPVHQRGISPVRGLYFIGFPWLNSRKSGIIYGMAEDAQYVAGAISRQLA
jgi:putative flavoprotein involved in K+ transport